MARNPVLAAVKPIRDFLESLGPRITFRKLHGILNALEMQVEDGQFQGDAVALLCEALLATAKFYAIDEQAIGRLEQPGRTVIDLAKKAQVA